jgi:hypothetical protein
MAIVAPTAIVAPAARLAAMGADVRVLPAGTSAVAVGTAGAIRIFVLTFIRARPTRRALCFGDDMKNAIAIRHVQFEDLGTLAPALQRAGYDVSYLDVDSGDLTSLDPLAPDLLVVLGGPVGVYQTDAYPFLADELRLLETRLKANRPTRGRLFQTHAE